MVELQITEEIFTEILKQFKSKPQDIIRKSKHVGGATVLLNNKVSYRVYDNRLYTYYNFRLRSIYIINNRQVNELLNALNYYTIIPLSDDDRFWEDYKRVFERYRYTHKTIFSKKYECILPCGVQVQINVSDFCEHYKLNKKDFLDNKYEKYKVVKL